MTPESLSRVSSLLRRSFRALRFVQEDPRAALEAFVLERVLRRPVVYDDRHGLRYVLRPRENAAAYFRARGNYEIAETEHCAHYLRPGMVAFDVGAHIGLYTLLFARIVGNDGAVHAFEADLENARRLRVNVLLNDLTNVVVAEVAVAAAPGLVTLNRFANGLNAWHSLGRPRMPDPDAPRRTVEPVSSVEVEAITLDDHCARNRVDSIDLLKIDVEGAEVDVLRGATRLLEQRAVRAIQFEVSRPQVESLGHRPGDVFDLLRDAGFSCFRLEGDGRSRAKVTAPTADYANYFAIESSAKE